MPFILIFIVVYAAGLCVAQDAQITQDDLDQDNHGSEMLSLQEAYVIRPGHFSIGLAIENYDRDPLGIDAFEGKVFLRAGIVKRMEFYGSYEIVRSVNVAGAHPVPAPPLDIIVLDSSRRPSDPYRAMYWPLPYVTHHPTRVDDMIPGEFALGLKFRIFRQKKIRPAVSASLQTTIPSTRALYELSKGSGSGGIDTGLHGAATWRYKRIGLTANLGVTRTSDLKYSDRFIEIPGDSANNPVTNHIIKRPYILDGGVGVRLRLIKGASALIEYSGWTYFGSHTPMQNESGASDVLAGVQVTMRPFRMSLGVLRHLNPPPDRMTLNTGPLAGGLDLSSVPAEEQNSFLESLGVDVHRDRRPGTNLVVIGLPEGASVPEGAKTIPDTYETHTSGNAGYIMRVSLDF